MPHDAAKDFAPIGLMARFPLILVASPAAGYRTAADFFKAARAQPRQLSYASVGAGSPHHLAFERIRIDRAAGCRIHSKNEKGGNR